MKEYKKEQIEEFVKSSSSVTQVLRKMNYSVGSAAFNQFFKYCSINNIDISNLLKDKNKSKGRRDTLPIEVIAVENSPHSRNTLRTKILKLGLKKYECEECGHPPEWRGKEIHLILDHINGINNDHRLENLRFLCPMCNAALDTHGGKNRKKNYKKCEECGKDYSGNNKKLCSKSCAVKANAKFPRKDRKVERPTYEDLILEIEKTSFLAAGRKYGVSDNAVRKWIKFYEKNLEIANKMRE